MDRELACSVVGSAAFAALSKEGRREEEAARLVLWVPKAVMMVGMVGQMVQRER